eukprot:13783774-Alexandrium_andersonii.AAC.1
MLASESAAAAFEQQLQGCTPEQVLERLGQSEPLDYDQYVIYQHDAPGAEIPGICLVTQRLLDRFPRLLQQMRSWPGE